MIGVMPQSFTIRLCAAAGLPIFLLATLGAMGGMGIDGLIDAHTDLIGFAVDLIISKATNFIGIRVDVRSCAIGLKANHYLGG